MPRPTANPYEVGQPLRAALNTRDTAILDWVGEFGGLDVFNVKEAPYNATGDGTTNDTTAIQAAIDAAIAAGGGIVFFPEGMYLANGLTCAGDNVTFLGTGWGSILRQVASAADNTALLTVAGTGTTTASNRVALAFHDLQLYGRAETDTFSQFVHLLALSGVSDVVVRRCLFKGWRGDGVYLASGFPSPVERHNERVHITNCLFDGVNKNNRNGVTVIDGTDIYITRSSFRNCSATDMPGAIDVEPNNNAYHRVRNIHIEDNDFENVGGNVGNVALDMNPTQASLTTKTQGIFIRGNTIRGTTNSQSAIFIRHKQTPTLATEPNNIVIEGNHVFGPVEAPVYIEGVRGIQIRNNYFGNTTGEMPFGYAFAVMGAELTGNHLHKLGTTSGTAVGVWSMSRLLIARNVFDSIGLQDGSTGRVVAFNFNSSPASASSDIDMVENRVIGTTATTFSSKSASHTLDAASNLARDNKTTLAVNAAHFTAVQSPLVVELTADVASAATTSFADITGLSFPVVSGRNYRYVGHILYTASADTIGLRVSITGPSTTHSAYMTRVGPGGTTGGAAGSAATMWTNVQTANDSGVTSTASVATTGGNILIIEGIIRPSANGTVQLRFAPETATASGIIIEAGSTLTWW